MPAASCAGISKLCSLSPAVALTCCVLQGRRGDTPAAFCSRFPGANPAFLGVAETSPGSAWLCWWTSGVTWWLMSTLRDWGSAKITTVPRGTGKELGEEGCCGHLGTHWHICHSLWDHSSSLGCAGGGKGFTGVPWTANREMLHPYLVSPCTSIFKWQHKWKCAPFSHFLSGQIPAAACSCTFILIFRI